MSTTAEQPTIEDLVFEFTRFHKSACKVSQQAISDGLMLLVQNAIKLLAEEAEREAAGYSHEQERHVVNYGYLSTDLASLEHNRKVTAAWLRQKAEEGP